MPTYVLKYDTETRRCREVVAFPPGQANAATWNAGRYRVELGQQFEVELVFAGGPENVLNSRWCVLNDRAHPVRFRDATQEELELNSLEAFQAFTARRKESAAHER